MYRYLYRARPYFTKPPEKAYTILGLTLLSLIIFGAFAIRPTLTTIAHLSREIKDGREANEALEEKIKSLSLAQSTYEKIKEDLYLVKGALPVEKETPALLENLALISGKNNTTLSALRMKESKPSSLDPSLMVQPFSLELSGTYPNLISVLEDLEKSLRIIGVENVKIAKGETEEEEGTLRIHLDLQTFYYKSAESEGRNANFRE